MANQIVNASYLRVMHEPVPEPHSTPGPCEHPRDYLRELEKAVAANKGLLASQKLPMGGSVELSPSRNGTIRVTFDCQPSGLGGDKEFSIRLAVVISTPKGIRTVEETFYKSLDYVESHTVNTLVADAMNLVAG